MFIPFRSTTHHRTQKRFYFITTSQVAVLVRQLLLQQPGACSLNMFDAGGLLILHLITRTEYIGTVFRKSYICPSQTMYTQTSKSDVLPCSRLTVVQYPSRRLHLSRTAQLFRILIFMFHAGYMAECQQAYTDSPSINNVFRQQIMWETLLSSFLELSEVMLARTNFPSSYFQPISIPLQLPFFKSKTS